ncbi:tetratricopeptide repeat protein [Nostoc sp.]|uniref:tetratricopeptide repeat protein n=1 Tax=Nostoc sp. TaxID=1180 RepID=UPI002FFBF3E6
MKQKPDDVVAYVRLAKLLSDQNKTEAALALFQQALKIEPSVQIYTDLGMWLLDIQKPEEAIAAFQEALRLNPGHQNAAQAFNKLQHNSHDR